MKIVNSVGQICYEQSGSGFISNELTINTEKLLPGIYVFYLNSTDKTLSFKFIK